MSGAGSDDFERLRLTRWLAITALALGALGVASAHRSALVRERARDRTVIIAAASLVGGELALNAGARWLRHPTRVEPWAYGHDGPGVVDADPAGAFATPVREGLTAGYRAPTHARLVRTPSQH